MTARTRQILVVLGEARMAAPDEVLQAHAALFPDAGPLSLVDGESTGDTLSLRTPTSTFKVGLVPAPIPRTELRSAIQGAWYWPEAEDTLRPARAHAVISAHSESGDAIELMFALTRVVAAFASVSPSLGVYVAGAHQLHKVEDFISEAGTATREQLPLYLWVRFELAEQSDGTISLYTSGMSQFDLMEVELPHSTLEPQAMMDRAFNVAHYLLERGAVLSHGHTIGTSANERFAVTHAASERAGHDRVYRLELQAAKQPTELLN